MPRPLAIDPERLAGRLIDLLTMPSPVGYTDNVVHMVCGWLTEMGAEFELTRRGAVRVNVSGAQASPDRAIVGHVDTLGAQVTRLKENGRLALRPIGHWSSRFAEGARVTLLSRKEQLRGTILPLKASGHTYNEEVDSQPTTWDHVELRVDAPVSSIAELEAIGVHVGDLVAVDAQPELSPHGFINSRHLDDKAGVAAMLAALEALVTGKVPLPVDCHFLFTISEEVGVGASAVLHGDVAEMVAVDNGTVAPGQNSSEYGVTVAMGDMTGPFDYHLTHMLLGLCSEHKIPHQRDVFRFYRADAASALEAGNDIRTALLCFGIDASHGYERTNLDALVHLARLLTVYAQMPPAVARDKAELSSLKGFPDQPQVGEGL
ncbi:MAG: osmoprotectant NAGGN system M42 family peptidase [Alphaproteobacteria bacterium]